MFKRLVSEGMEIPPYYGVAWRCVESRRTVYYPVPLNHIMGALRNVYWAIKIKHTDVYDSIASKSFTRGWREGWATGSKIAMERRGKDFEEGRQVGITETMRIVKREMRKPCSDA